MPEKDSPQLRELVFRNLLNGVPPQQVAETFRISVAEAGQVFAFVMAKIRSYAFEQKMPPVMVDSLAQARRREHRMVLLMILDKLNLAKEPAYRRVSYNSVDQEFLRDIR